jgi:general secretion pathway protein G
MLGMLLLTLATVMVVAVVRIKCAERSAKRIRVKNDVQFLAAQLRTYQTINGSLPTTDQGLRALVQIPKTLPRPANWRRLVDYIPPDPWNTEYVYRYPGIKNSAGYDLFAAGPDRKPYTEDDVWGE